MKNCTYWDLLKFRIHQDIFNTIETAIVKVKQVIKRLGGKIKRPADLGYWLHGDIACNLSENQFSYLKDVMWNYFDKERDQHMDCCTGKST